MSDRGFLHGLKMRNLWYDLETAFFISSPTVPYAPPFDCSVPSNRSDASVLWFLCSVAHEASQDSVFNLWTTAIVSALSTIRLVQIVAFRNVFIPQDAFAFIRFTAANAIRRDRMTRWYFVTTVGFIKGRVVYLFDSYFDVFSGIEWMPTYWMFHPAGSLIFDNTTYAANLLTRRGSSPAAYKSRRVNCSLCQVSSSEVSLSCGRKYWPDLSSRSWFLQLPSPVGLPHSVPHDTELNSFIFIKFRCSAGFDGRQPGLVCHPGCRGANLADVLALPIPSPGFIIADFNQAPPSSSATPKSFKTECGSSPAFQIYAIANKDFKSFCSIWIDGVSGNPFHLLLLNRKGEACSSVGMDVFVIFMRKSLRS
ncbi:hypothetical protein FNV43_RR09634 [Rhamnella rubrinervis]|uniref:Uncharacterized protein n=1 Tax=Rhamnella rubrinervis TaxID=2594499 RepID=A0A8K0HAF5_9ROSA|nr:hypothetical protein FNV43_RR09634 [Rhamnella rubrinervis]